MSMFSGKCDLCDHIMGMGGWYDRDGNPVKIGDPDVRAYYSDEYRDFLAFRKQTGGVIHQYKKIKVTNWNYEEVEKLCPQFKAIKHTRIVPDKRQKSGQREETYYTYKYYDKEYSLKEINKKGVYFTVNIEFNTLLDLIPYYPYIVCMSCGSEVVISNQSYVDEAVEDALEAGYFPTMWRYYKKALQDHYREIVLRYYDPTGYECEEEVEFDPKTFTGQVSSPIDDQFRITWILSTGSTLYWVGPKIIDADHGVIKIHEVDFKRFGGKAKVYYVKQRKRDVWIG